jgi:hypothetical protein
MTRKPMKCPRCTTTSPVEARFCPRCGHAFTGPTEGPVVPDPGYVPAKTAVPASGKFFLALCLIGPLGLVAGALAGSWPLTLVGIIAIALLALFIMVGSIF